MRNYPTAVLGCLLHALAASACQLFTYPLWAKFRYAWLGVYLLLVVSWPLWGFALWKFAAVQKSKATAIPMLFGLLILSPVIILICSMILGINISPVPQ